MATIIIEVQDKKLKFVRELLNQLSFVKIREDQSSETADPVDAPVTKAQMKADLREAIDEVNQYKQGKKPLRSAWEVLDEL